MARNQTAVDRAAKNASRIARTTDAKVDLKTLSSGTLEQIISDVQGNSPSEQRNLSRKAATELARRGPGGK